MEVAAALIERARWEITEARIIRAGIEAQRRRLAKQRESLAAEIAAARASIPTLRW